MSQNNGQPPPGFYRYPQQVGYREWTVPNSITNLEFAACGAYGTVCKAKFTEDGEVENVVVKKLINPFENNVNAEKSLREIKYLASLSDSDYIVEIIKVFTDTDYLRRDFDNVYLVTADCGNSLRVIFGVGWSKKIFFWKKTIFFSKRKNKNFSRPLPH